MYTAQLNGCWEVGENREYQGEAVVPGIQRDPAQMQKGTLWFRKKVTLPAEPFTRLSLLLKGARFCPAVYVSGDLVARSEGGMAPVRLVFSHRDCVPLATVALEICLLSLADVPPDDASRIPDADLWRSNVSSGLWDEVELSTVGDVAVTGVVPRVADDGRSLSARVELNRAAPECTLEVALCARDGTVLSVARRACAQDRPLVRLDFERLKPWEPANPQLYTLTVTASCGGVSSAMSVSLGWKRFCVCGKGFTLNGHPETLRGVSVVWHRFCRDPEGRSLAFDRQWFARNLFDRLQAMGANFIRFHLGPPPEWLLEEADRRGFCVQLEWLFFHGIAAGADSLGRQWRDLLSLAARHPCVCVVHPWNETENEQTARAAGVLEALCAEFPPVVLSHRDVTRVHKYWWSLFENLSLSYDDADDFDKPVIADEFGGNYLDGEGKPGLYPDAPVAFERFLGPDATAEERLELQALANGRVAEYWRRVGVAGFSTFCALSSPEDGSHHFLGPLQNGKPKPVWEACAAAFARESVSLEIWDRAFVRGQTVTLPLWFFRDADGAGELTAVAEVLDECGRVTDAVTVTAKPAPWGRCVTRVTLKLPRDGERCTLRARLADARACSAWPVRLYGPLAAPARRRAAFVLDGDPELCAFAEENGLRLARSLAQSDVMLGTQTALENLNRDEALRAGVERCVREGAGLLLTQLGPRLLGEGYVSEKRNICVDGPTETAQSAQLYRLPFGLRLRFDALPEAESCCHRAVGSEFAWRGLQRQALQLSNGYRGGLNVPAASMEVSGVSREAFAAQWTVRGADGEGMRQEAYTAYELCGFFAFASGDSREAREALRARVRALVEDAPSLALSMDPETEILTHPLGRLYRDLPERGGTVTPLVRCGRALARAPAVLVRLEQSRIILSQLLTGGRLSPAFADGALYGAHYDPEMARLMRNMLDAL